jgi:hypothetical protein
MKYAIKNTALLKKILWLDFFLGISTSLLGLVFYSFFSQLFYLNEVFVLVVSIITFLYACFAFLLAKQKAPCIYLVRILIIANFIWAFISIAFMFYHFNTASILGKGYLFLQIIFVGLLALLENNQFKKIP